LQAVGKMTGKHKLDATIAKAQAVVDAGKVGEVETALDELTLALQELSACTAVAKATGTRAPASTGAPRGYTGKYLPLPAMMPPMCLPATTTVSTISATGTKKTSTAHVTAVPVNKKPAVAKPAAVATRPQQAAAPDLWSLSVAQGASGRWKITVSEKEKSSGGGAAQGTSGGGISVKPGQTPIGHTNFSWVPPLGTTPVGHTDFSWQLPGAGGDTLAKLSAALASERAAVAALAAAIKAKEELMAMKAMLATEKAAAAALEAALGGGAGSDAMAEVAKAQATRRLKLGKAES
jgi:hypothetical protein